jgi:hypothetical protein
MSTTHATGPATRVVPRAPVAPSRLFVCGECAHAQLFAVQPRALCMCEGSPFRDKVLFAGQPGCRRLVPRRGTDPIAAWCSPGTKRTSRRFAETGRSASAPLFTER